MKKKILIGVGVVAAIVLIILAFFVILDVRQEDKLLKEADEIIEMTNQTDMNMDQIRAKLKRTVTKGDYGIVEKAFKQYMSDSLDNMEEMIQIMNDDTITKSLTVENYKEDGPDFTKTKAYLEETKQKLDNDKNKYYDFLSEEKADSYLDGKNLDAYYVELYQKEMIGDLENERKDKTIDNAINEIVSLLNNSENIIDFLIENKNQWKIEQDHIVFATDALTSEYEDLADNI